MNSPEWTKRSISWMETAPWTWEAEGYRVYENRGQFFIENCPGQHGPFASFEDAFRACEKDFAQKSD